MIRVFQFQNEHCFGKHLWQKKAAEEKKERTPLDPSTEPSDDTQDNLQGGKKTADQEQSLGFSEEDSSSFLP